MNKYLRIINTCLPAHSYNCMLMYCTFMSCWWLLNAEWWNSGVLWGCTDWIKSLEKRRMMAKYHYHMKHWWSESMNKYLCPFWKMTSASPSVLAKGPAHQHSLDSYFGGNETIGLWCSPVLIGSLSDVSEANVPPLRFCLQKYLLRHEGHTGKRLLFLPSSLIMGIT